MKKEENIFYKNKHYLIGGLILLMVIAGIVLVYSRKNLTKKEENQINKGTDIISSKQNTCAKLDQIAINVDIPANVLSKNYKATYQLFFINEEYKEFKIFILNKNDNFDDDKDTGLVVICNNDSLLFESKTYSSFVVSSLEFSVNGIYGNSEKIKDYFVIEHVGTFGIKEKKLISKHPILGESWVGATGVSRLMISKNYASTETGNILDLRTGKVLLRENYYDDTILDEVEPKYIRVAISGKYGLVDLSDNVLIPIEYDFISRSENYFATIQNGSLKVYDQNFNSILKSEILITKKENYEYLDFRPAGESNQLEIHENDNEIVIFIGNFVCDTRVTINKSGEFVNIEERTREI